MRTPFVLTLLVAALLGGCSTTGSIGTNAADAGHASALKPAMPPVGHNLVHDGVDPAPVSVEPMPFGQHPFGPWSVPNDSTWPSELGVVRRNPRVHHAEATVDPNEPITVDFVKNDLHTTLHYLGLKLGLQIIAYDLHELILVKVPSNLSVDELVRWLEENLDLRFLLDGDVLIVKRAAAIRVSGHVQPQGEQRFQGEFIRSDAVAAIMETAMVTKTQVFVPSSLKSEFSVAFKFQNSSADTILRKIAEQAGLNVEVKDGAYLFSRPEPTRKD